MLCEAFTISPAEAEQLDEELARGVIRARGARRAHDVMNDEKRKMTESQTKMYQRMLDALDARDRRLGRPEEG